MSVIWTLISVIVGALAATGGSFLLKLFDERRKATNLKVAFRGEISALRAALKADLLAAQSACISTGLGNFTTQYPKVIYDSHAAQIGGLRDTALVGQISKFYTVLDRVNTFSKRLSTFARPDQANFVAMLANCLESAVIIDMRLEEETKRVVKNFKITVSQECADDANLAKGIATEMMEYANRQSTSTAEGANESHGTG